MRTTVQYCILHQFIYKTLGKAQSIIYLGESGFKGTK
jgi:hypothetical protein